MIQEKLSQSLAFKDEGNELYKAKEYKKAMRKYHNAILYLKGIDNDLHGTPAFLQTSSVDPNSGKNLGFIWITVLKYTLNMWTLSVLNLSQIGFLLKVENLTDIRSLNFK